MTQTTNKITVTEFIRAFGEFAYKDDKYLMYSDGVKFLGGNKHSLVIQKQSQSTAGEMDKASVHPSFFHDVISQSGDFGPQWIFQYLEVDYAGLL